MTDVGPLTARSAAAATGPPSVVSESSMPRTAFAAVRSAGEFASAGRSAECAGRYSARATVATTANPYVAAAGPPVPVTAAAPASIAARDYADGAQHSLAANPVGPRREKRCQ